VKECSKNKVSLFASSTGLNYNFFKNSDVMIKINMKNSFLLLGENPSKKVSSDKICKRLQKVLGIKQILLTKGNEGIAIFEDDYTIEMPATKDEKIDIKGIGEIMIAAIAMSLTKNGDFQEACKLGNIAAGLATSRGNIKSITKSEILKAKREYEDWLAQK